MSEVRPLAVRTTPAQLGALVVLVQAIRPEWDTRAIRPALEDLADRDLADLAFAAIRASQDSTMRRPAAIGFDQHWRPTVRDIETPGERAARIQAQLDAAEERRREDNRLTDEQRAARARRLADEARANIRRGGE